MVSAPAVRLFSRWGRMANSENGPPDGIPLEFQTAQDHVTAYIDTFNVVRTGREVIISAYQTLPGYPSAEGVEAATRTRRATLILSPEHALDLGLLLVKQGTKEEGEESDA